MRFGFNDLVFYFQLSLKIAGLLFFYSLKLEGQSYVQYRTGAASDTLTIPLGGICLMGGAREDDNAMKWFLRRANGGDVLILRASGSDGYNDYLFRDLGVPVHSVETIRFDEAAASSEKYIHERIQQAEAIWLAGGDQSKYVDYWRQTAIDSLINEAIAERQVAIGGTSAGMAILSNYYFSARIGTIHSPEAIANPYHEYITVDTTTFLKIPFLRQVITDTHYGERNRQGRHMVFLGRLLSDYGIAARGIACDEYTAVCIEPDGRARVFGEYPDREDNAFFIQTNCTLRHPGPEQCRPDQSMVWERGQQALKVYNIKGTASGERYFDLANWQAGIGGDWQHWFITEGQVQFRDGTPVDCAIQSK